MPIEFLLTPPDASQLYQGHYDPGLVALSVLAACLGALVALLVMRRAGSAASRRTRAGWIACAGLALGAGVWTMHFVGMLALELPCGTGYEPRLTALSTLPGMLACALALGLTARPAISPRRLLASGLLLGGGIGTMHYVGMAAYRISGAIRHDPRQFLLSVLAAVLLSTLALWLKLRLEPGAPQPARGSGRQRSLALTACALAIGIASSAIHYIAMASSYFVLDETPGSAGADWTPEFLASVVLAIGAALMIAALAATVIEKSGQALQIRLPLIATLIGIWTAAAWIATDHYVERQQTRLHEEARQDIARRLQRLDTDLNDRIDVVRGVTRLLARQAGLQATLSASDASGRDPALDALERQLTAIAHELRIDAIRVIDAQGRCIAASQTDPGCVGSDLSEHGYFSQARRQGSAQQYTPGLNQQEASLYQATAVHADGRFLGVVAARYRIRDFAPLIQGTDTLISDPNGVIILADDPELEFRRTEHAPAPSLNAEEIEPRPGHRIGAPLRPSPWLDGRFDGVLSFGPEPHPVLVAHRRHADSGIELHIHMPLPELERLQAQKAGIFLIVALAGDLLVLTVAAILLYGLSRQRERATEQKSHEQVDAALDVAERANRNLAKREVLLQAIFDSAGSAICLSDCEGRLLQVNPRTTELFQYSCDELQRLNYLDLIADEERADVLGALPALSSARVSSLIQERRLRRSDGTLFWGDTRGCPLRDENGAINGIVWVLDDVSNRHESEERIRYQAWHDYLTGLPNRAWLIDHATQALLQARRHRRHFALIAMDLDGFKAINDLHGHDAGDFVLRGVAQRVSRILRASDSLCRQGGDEFVVLLSEVDEGSALPTIAAKIREAVETPCEFKGNELVVGASLGLALYPEQGETLDTLLRHADAAMYQDKSERQRGRPRALQTGMLTPDADPVVRRPRQVLVNSAP